MYLLTNMYKNHVEGQNMLHRLSVCRVKRKYFPTIMIYKISLTDYIVFPSKQSMTFVVPLKTADLTDLRCQISYQSYNNEEQNFLSFVQQQTSSLAILISSCTSVNTVGCMKYPLSPCCPPPYTRVAPSLFPLSINDIILPNCSASTLKNVKH